MTVTSFRIHFLILPYSVLYVTNHFLPEDAFYSRAGKDLKVFNKSKGLPLPTDKNI